VQYLQQHYDGGSYNIYNIIYTILLFIIVCVCMCVRWRFHGAESDIIFITMDIIICTHAARLYNDTSATRVQRIYWDVLSIYIICCIWAHTHAHLLLYINMHSNNNIIIYVYIIWPPTIITRVHIYVIICRYIYIVLSVRKNSVRCHTRDYVRLRGRHKEVKM